MSVLVKFTTWKELEKEEAWRLWMWLWEQR